MKKKVLIVGGNGHGSLIASCINDNNLYYKNYEYEVAGFLNDYEANIDGYPVIGKSEDIKDLIAKGFYFAWGIHLIGRNVKTFETFKRMSIPLSRLVTIVHHSAFIGENVILEPGVLVMSNAYIAPRCIIRTGSMVKSNACLGHDVKCGRLCHFAMGSITGSFTELGTCSDIAIGATCLEKLKIGDFSMLGAASLATHDIPSREIHTGIPAHFFRRINEY